MSSSSQQHVLKISAEIMTPCINGLREKNCASLDEEHMDKMSVPPPFTRESEAPGDFVRHQPSWLLTCRK